MIRLLLQLPSSKLKRRRSWVEPHTADSTVSWGNKHSECAGSIEIWSALNTSWHFHYVQPGVNAQMQRDL